MHLIVIRQPFFFLKTFAGDPEAAQFLSDATVKAKLANAKKLSDVNAEDYDAIFFVGGHGPVFDLAFDTINAQLVSQV